MTISTLKDHEASWHVLMSIGGNWVLLGSFDPDCEQQAQAMADYYADRNKMVVIVAKAVRETTGY